MNQVKRGLRPRSPRPSGPYGPERPAGLVGVLFSRYFNFRSLHSSFFSSD